MKILYLDESGDHNLTKIDDQYPVFVLADLVVSPIGRHILGKNRKKDFEIIEQKFRKDKDGKVGGYGLVVLPRSN